jgi:hypothetical protein
MFRIPVGLNKIVYTRGDIDLSRFYPQLCIFFEEVTWG